MKRIIEISVNTIISIPLLYIVWLCLRMLVFDYFTVPTSSMTPTIQPGSKVIVNKMIFGPRIYTDLHFDMQGQELQSVRLKGFRDIGRNDIVVFNFPIHRNKISFKINHVYCKRVVGLPGDTVMAKKGHLYNNNFQGVLGCKEKQEQLESKTERILRHYDVYDVAPRDSIHFAWTIQDWGPLYVPRRGDVIKVTPREAVLYHKILEWETEAEVTYDWDTGKVYANGTPMSVHTFKHNYYHICGDYSLDSFDSRYWGFVPEEYIVGVVEWII